MIEYLYQALASPRGIVIRVSDRKLAINKLYAARAKAKSELHDDSLDNLSLVLSPTADDEIMIIHKEQPHAD